MKKKIPDMLIFSIIITTLLIVANGGYYLFKPTILNIFLMTLDIILAILLLKTIDTKEIISYLIIVIFCAMPLILIYIDYDFTQHAKINFAIIITLIIFSIFLYGIYKGNIKIELNRQDYMLILYLVFILLSTIFAINKRQAIWGIDQRYEGVITLIVYFTLYFVTSRVFKFNEKYLFFISVSALLIALYGIAQFFGIDPISGSFKSGCGYRASSTIGNSNFLGSYLILILPIFILLYIKRKEAVHLFTSAILFLSMLCTLTRSAWLGFIASSLLIIFFVLKYKFSKRNLLVVYSIFLVIFISLNFYTQNKLLNRYASINHDIKIIVNNEKQESIYDGGSGRTFIWKRAVKLIPERPILGCGPDNFSIIFMNRFGKEVRKSFGDGVMFDKAHNEYLNIAVNTGIPSLLCYIAFLSIILLKAIKSLNANNIYAILVFTSVFGYLVQAFFNISVVAVAPLFWILLGILSCLSSCLSSFS